MSIVIRSGPATVRLKVAGPDARYAGAVSHYPTRGPLRALREHAEERIRVGRGRALIGLIINGFQQPRTSPAINFRRNFLASGNRLSRVKPCQESPRGIFQAFPSFLSWLLLRHGFNHAQGAVADARKSVGEIRNVKR